MVLSADPSAHLDLLLGLVRLGLGGPISGGRHFVSWIHERDFVRAVEFLLARDDFAGVVNLAAPDPLPQREFMAALRGEVPAHSIPVTVRVTQRYSGRPMRAERARPEWRAAA